MREVIDAARRSTAFSGLSEVQLQDVAGMARVVDVPAGGTIFREGDEGDAMYLVASGRVRVSRHGRDLASLGAGQLLGEMALVLDAPRTATAVADEASRLCRFSRDGFEELLESGDPAATVMLRNLARLACERLLALDEEISRPR